jgi:hypothetical protein
MDTHTSTTDPEVRLYHKCIGEESKLYYMRYTLVESRNGLVVDGRDTQAMETAEWMQVMDTPGMTQVNVGTDRAYDTQGFVAALRSMNAPYQYPM